MLIDRETHKKGRDIGFIISIAGALIGLFVMLFLFMGTSKAHAEEGTPDESPINVHPKVIWRTLPHGVTLRKTVYRGDPRLYVSPGHELTFRVYVANNKVIALSWMNSPIHMDPFAMTKTAIDNMAKEMKTYLANSQKYRFVSIVDWDEASGGSGVLYSPYLFPKGFSITDVKW